MYKIIITEDLNVDIYVKLIDYSFSKSDAFMLVTYRESDNIELMFKEPSNNKQLSNELRQIISRTNKEAKEKKYEELAIFKQKTETFLSKLEPYLVKKRNFPTEWPGVKVVLNKYTNVDICVYRICEKVKTYLLESKGLFKLKYPYFPDDLSFFKNGYCWFATVSHEGYACMYIQDYDDIITLRKLGLNFKITEASYDKVDLFYESYKL